MNETPENETENRSLKEKIEDEMVVSDCERYRQEAHEIAEEKDFDPGKMLVCTDCGRTVVRTQKSGNPGWKDKVYCTCEDYGSPMVSVEPEDTDE